MPLNSISTAVAGTVYTAARRNSEVKENLEDIESSGRVFVSATQIAFGGAVNANSAVYITPSFTGPADNVFGFVNAPTLSATTAGGNLYAAYFTGTLAEFSSGVHALLATAAFVPATVTAGVATVTNTATLYVSGAMSATVTGGNYALWVASGTSLFGGNIAGSGTFTIRNNTASGSDTGMTILAGGGGTQFTRGANVAVYGNQNGAPGYITMELGNVAGAFWKVYRQNNVEMFKMDGSNGGATFTSSKTSGAVIFNGTETADTTNNQVLRINSYVANTATLARFIQFVSANDANNVGQIRMNNAAVAYDTTSDERLKTFVGPSRHGLATILAIDLQDYFWTDDPQHQLRTGVSAQQLHGVFPEAVGVGGDNPRTNPWGVDYGKLTAPLIRSVQEFYGQFVSVRNDHEWRIAALESRGH